MSYIDKNGNTVISVRMTDKGREKLSIGQLNFNTFKLGDSEVDYETLGASYDITLENVLRSKACQPSVKTWLLPTPSDTSGMVELPALTVIELGSTVVAPEKGFFLTGNTSGTTIISSFSAQTTDTYTLNEGLMNVSSLTGGTIVPIVSGSTTGSYEPIVGDLMMVKYSNPDLTDPQTEGEVELSTPVPYLWYKIQDKTGSVSANTLTVTVDRDLPDFTGYGGSNTNYVVFYPSGDQFGDTGYFSGGTVWNQNNVWSYPMAGINTTTYETFTSYGSESYVGSKEYFGYTSELSGSCEMNKSISILHYSRPETCLNQSEVTYGQKLHVDLDNSITPVLKMPTLMWHYNTGTTIGQTFSGTGVEQYVTQNGNNTDIRYFDLADQVGNNVGRVFPDQQVFTIDNEELVMAMSYKSNRNWTLPQVIAGLKTSTDGLMGNTHDLHVTYLFNNTSSGFTAGIHNQTHTCLVIGEENVECPDGTKKDVEVTFPIGQLPYMSVTGSTGWYANEFQIITQRVITGERPDPTAWKIIDFTSNIDSHVSGRIDPTNMEASTFLITKALYDAASTYNLHDYLNIPETAETSLLQFGDEAFFYGNVCANGITNKYRTKFDFVIPPTQWNTSNNPTWLDSGQNPHISEVAVYDTDNNVVAIGKENLPIEKTNNTTIIIEIAFDM